MLPKLLFVYVDDNFLEKVSDNAFESESKEELFIEFVLVNNDKMNCEAFGPNSLSGINRPATVVVGGVDFKKLNKATFINYLSSRPDHKIEIITQDNVTCNCDWFWLKQEKEKFEERFEGNQLICEGFGVEVWDMKDEDFGDCKI